MNRHEELVDLIDSLMEKGSGHVNITADSDCSDITVKVVNSTEFSGKGACCQPNEDLDESED